MAGIDLKINLAGDYTDVDDISVAHGDFQIRGGKFQMVAEDDLPTQVGQRLHIRLLLHRGEVFFNTNAGFPYTDISKFKRSTGIFDTYMKAYLVATDGVTKLDRYISDLDGQNRVQNVRFDSLITDGQTITTNQEFDV